MRVAPGLYRNDTIFKKVLHSLKDWVDRFSFVFDGKLIRMNHSLKAPVVPWKTPSELKPGEWTYQKGAYFIKIDAAKTLADYKIEVPVMNSGVQISGSVSYLVIKNLTVTHVINDGFALTVGKDPASKVRDILYQKSRRSSVATTDSVLTATARFGSKGSFVMIARRASHRVGRRSTIGW